MAGKNGKFTFLLNFGAMMLVEKKRFGVFPFLSQITHKNTLNLSKFKFDANGAEIVLKLYHLLGDPGILSVKQERDQLCIRISFHKKKQLRLSRSLKNLIFLFKINRIFIAIWLFYLPVN